MEIRIVTYIFHVLLSQMWTCSHGDHCESSLLALYRPCRRGLWAFTWQAWIMGFYVVIVSAQPTNRASLCSRAVGRWGSGAVDPDAAGIVDISMAFGFSTDH